MPRDRPGAAPSRGEARHAEACQPKIQALRLGASCLRGHELCHRCCQRNPSQIRHCGWGFFSLQLSVVLSK